MICPETCFGNMLFRRADWNGDIKNKQLISHIPYNFYQFQKCLHSSASNNQIGKIVTFGI